MNGGRRLGFETVPELHARAKVPPKSAATTAFNVSGSMETSATGCPLRA